MNSIERVTKTLNHQEADRVPVYPLINSISRNYLGINYAEWTKDPHKCAQSIIKATEECDVDVICTLVDLSIEAADWGMMTKALPWEIEESDRCALWQAIIRRFLRN